MQSFDPPATEAWGNDWVMVLDDPNLIYSVESSANLIDWAVIVSGPGTGAARSVAVPTNAAPRQFLRLRFNLVE